MNRAAGISRRIPPDPRRRPGPLAAPLLAILALAATAPKPLRAEVDGATYAAASARFERAMQSDEAGLREGAIREFSAVRDVRSARLLFATIRAKLRRLDALERDLAKHEEELERFEEIAAKSRTSRRPSSYLTEERRRLQSAVRQAGEARNGMEATVRSLEEGVARVLLALEGIEQVQGLEFVRDKGLGSDAIDMRMAAASVLGRLPLPASRHALSELLRGDPEIAVRVRAALAWGELPPEEPPTPLLDALDDEAWQVRAAAIASLVRLRSPAAVPRFLDLLDREDGRLQEDLLDALRDLSGEDFHDNTALWKDWWANGGTVVPKAPPPSTKEGAPEAHGKDGHAPRPKPGDSRARPPEAPARAPTRYGTSFYGITTRSKSILFILDVSGSMNEMSHEGSTTTKLQVAKDELLRAIANLPEGSRFNLVFFGDTVSTWQKEMVEFVPKSEKKAREFIEGTFASGGTNLFGGLREGFEVAGLGVRTTRLGGGPDTIFLLSDGQPTRGELTDPIAILAEVNRWNEIHRIRIHAIGVGKQHNRKLMEGLANGSGGTYVQR